MTDCSLAGGCYYFHAETDYRYTDGQDCVTEKGPVRDETTRCKDQVNTPIDEATSNESSRELVGGWPMLKSELSMQVLMPGREWSLILEEESDAKEKGFLYGLSCDDIYDTVPRQISSQSHFPT